MKRSSFLSAPRFPWFVKTSLAVILSLSLSGFGYAEDPVTPVVHPPRTAYEVWSEMAESSLTGKPIPITVSGTSGVISYGGEKEGSSSLLSRVMGLSNDGFKAFLALQDEPAQKSFLRELLGGFAKKQYRLDNVVDIEGKTHAISWSFLKGKAISSLELPELNALFQSWLDQTDDNPFSFIKPQARQKIFNGTFVSGAAGKLKGKYYDYSEWKPLLGEPEKYLTAAHGTSVGWEINFKPQKTYGDFETMIVWFKKKLSTNGQDFESLGHQWIVYPKRKGVDVELNAKTKLPEIYKNVQAYIVLKGITGGSNIELGNYKNVQSDNYLNIETHSTGRGVIRLETSYKSDGLDAYNIEQRAGTKSDPVRRFVQFSLSSRYAADEFDDLADAQSWLLVPNEGASPELESRFGVSTLEARQVQNTFAQTKFWMGGKERRINQAFLVPFWRWENAPYLSAEKKSLLSDLTKNFVRNIAYQTKPSPDFLREQLKIWCLASGLETDIENYLRPKQKIADTHVFADFSGAAKSLKINVNEIDLGIEYSARFPMKTRPVLTDNFLGNGKKGWIATEYDLTSEERIGIIKKTAQALGKELTGKSVEVVSSSTGDHGHELVIQYDLEDAKGRDWTVEWDGVGRNYDANGKVIEGSARGGHVELVTPKFQPTREEVRKVFTAFDKVGIIPSIRAGGGHINIDLAPFEGKPREFARFIAICLETRDVMSMMFQYAGRLPSAEPHAVSANLIAQLKDFRGTAAELKSLLYNEKFFNSRVGRKSRYVQFDVSAYFQDVIPSEFIAKDFDIKNDLWRRNFRVNPKIRKAEFRLMNAPRNAIESEMQVKFVRAVLSKALNDTSPLTGKVPAVDFESALADSKPLFRRFNEVMSFLELDPAEFKGIFVDGLDQTRSWMKSLSYKPYAEKMAGFPKVADWGKAVSMRSPKNGLNSEDRVPKLSDPVLEAISLKDREMLARKQLAVIREELGDMTADANMLFRRNEGKKTSSIVVAGEDRKLDQIESVYQKQKNGLMTAEEARVQMVELVKADYVTSLVAPFLDGRYGMDVRKIQWLLGFLPPQTVSSDQVLVFLANPRSEVRDFGVKLFSEMSADQKTRFFTNLPYASFGENEALVLDLFLTSAVNLNEPRYANVVIWLLNDAVDARSQRLRLQLLALAKNPEGLLKPASFLITGVRTFGKKSVSERRRWVKFVSSRVPVSRYGILSLIPPQDDPVLNKEITRIRSVYSSFLKTATPESLEALIGVIPHADVALAVYYKHSRSPEVFTPESAWTKLEENSFVKQGPGELVTLINADLGRGEKSLRLFLVKKAYGMMGSEQFNALLSMPDPDYRRAILKGAPSANKLGMVLSAFDPKDLSPEQFREYYADVVAEFALRPDENVTSQYRYAIYYINTKFKGEMRAEEFKKLAALSPARLNEVFAIAPASVPADAQRAFVALRLRMGVPVPSDELVSLLSSPDPVIVDLAMKSAAGRTESAIRNKVASLVKNEYPRVQTAARNYVSVYRENFDKISLTDAKLLPARDGVEVIFRKANDAGLSPQLRGKWKKEALSLFANPKARDIEARKLALKEALKSPLQTGEMPYRKMLIDAALQIDDPTLIATAMNTSDPDLRAKALSVLEKATPQQVAWIAQAIYNMSSEGYRSNVLRDFFLKIESLKIEASDLKSTVQSWLFRILISNPDMNGPARRIFFTLLKRMDPATRHSIYNSILISQRQDTNAKVAAVYLASEKDHAFFKALIEGNITHPSPFVRERLTKALAAIPVPEPEPAMVDGISCEPLLSPQVASPPGGQAVGTL